MKRTRLQDRQLPDYTRGEERFNMISHIVGAGFGIVVLFASVILAALQGSVWGIVSGFVYGIAMVSLFTVSSVYHGLLPGLGKKVMQVIDHCTIYVLISGTYTPILLVAIRPLYPTLAWVVFGIQWGLTAIAVALNAVDLKKFRVISMVLYIAMGWCIIFVLRPTIQAMGWNGFWWLLAGGICYTVGAVLYGLGKKIRYCHSVFHLLVDFGGILQAVALLFYVL